MRRAAQAISLGLVGLLGGSCLGSDAPTGPGSDARAEIAINPALIPSPADAGSRSIRRIRAVATQVPEGTVLGQATVDVDPAAPTWTLTLDVRLPISPLQATLTVLLLHVADGVESIEFSGVAGPLTLVAGAPPLAPEIPIVRGPPANVFVTSVAISSAPDTLLEGRSATLAAVATTSGTTAPTVFWTVLDSAVLALSSSQVTGRRPGTGRVVASAGAYADTAWIVVRPAPARIAIVPDTVYLAGAGARATFVAHVTDVRGDTLRTEPLAWRTLSPGIVASLGGGLFEAVAPGTGTIRAHAVADTTVSATAVAVVATAVLPRVDIEVQKTVDVAQPLAGQRITFTVRAVNRGPGTATDVAVFDTLRRSAFTSPTHTLSAGSLVGDSLWLIPSLGPGAAATWASAVTVASGVAGGSATNTAILRRVAERDSVPANDTARVSVNFPRSQVPVVNITSPPDSSVFDPGDPVTFEATATDAEDGDLSASVRWHSSLDGALATGRTFTTSSLRAGIHSITASATDSGGDTGADTIRVTIALYSMPATLSVPFGGTASLPITFAQPAPAGGITLTVASSAPQVANPTSSTIVIPEGARSANATIAGLLPGTANITVSNPVYGSAVVIVTVSASLNITQPSISFASPFTGAMTVRLESQGSPIAAPSGGLAVTLTSRAPACVAAPATIAIPAGQTTQSATLSYGGSASLPCQTYVEASATNVASDSVLVSVSPPPTIMVSVPGTLGAGLQASASNHGGVTLTLTSSDSTRLLVSPNATTPGSRSFSVNVPNGTQFTSFYVQGFEGATGTASVTATATGFNQGSASVNVVQPGIVLSGLVTSTTTLSADDHFYAFVGIPSGNTVSTQDVRAGSQGVIVTFSVDNLGVAQLTNGQITGDTVTSVIVSGLYYTPTSVAAGGVAFDPVGVGTATVRARAPGFVAQPLATQQVTVTAPTITVSVPGTVGAGLQASASVSLGASNHGGVTLTLTSSDSTTLLVSPNATTPGSRSFSVNVPNGTQFTSFYVQGFEGATGTSVVTATAAGFLNGTAQTSVVQPGIIISGLPSSLSAGAANRHFYAFVGIPSGNTVSTQNVRAGSQGVIVTFSVDNLGVAQLTNGQITGDTVTSVIVSGLYYTPTSVAAGGVAFDPVGVGTATVRARAPGFVAQPLATQQVTVTAPTITVSVPGTVGAGLQASASVSLGASNHGGVTLTLTSSDSTRLLVSPNATTPGSRSFSVNVPNGTQFTSFYVQGFEGATGTASVTATATGFNQGSASVNVVQPGIVLSGLVTSTTTLSADDHFYAFVGIPSGNTVSTQDVRAGSQGVIVTFSVDNLGVAQLTNGQITGDTVTSVIVSGLYYTPTSVAAGGVAFDPVGVGTATVRARAPGFVAQPLATQQVTVTAPTITVSVPGTVGAGLQASASVSLGASNHGGVTLTLTSSDSTTLLVSPNATTPGSRSFSVNVPNGTQFTSFYVQGFEGATGTSVVTATAAGFLNGTAQTSVVQPGIIISGLPSSLSAGAANRHFYAFVGIPSGNTVSTQNVRAGSPGVTVSATTSNVSVARLVTQTATGASVTAAIAPGVYHTPTSVAAGGIELDPLAAGQTTVSVSAPGFVAQPLATQQVTITP